MDKEEIRVTCLNVNCPERKSVCCGGISTVKIIQDGVSFDSFVCSKCDKEFIGGKCIGDMSWSERFDWEFPKWEEPQPGAGNGLGASAGHGMYIQYDADRKHRDGEVEKIKEAIKEIIKRTEFDILVKVLAECESAEDARACRHIIKDYILGEKK